MQIPNQYPLVLGVGIGMGIQCWYFGYQVTKERKKLFNTQFMIKHFGYKHQSELKQPIEIGGYPDMGSGVYSQQLSYSEWYNFNVLQRVHQNYIEGINTATWTLFSAGFFSPRYACILGLIYIIGRGIYASGYKSKRGHRSWIRTVGGILTYLALLGNIGIVGYNLKKYFQSR